MTQPVNALERSTGLCVSSARKRKGRFPTAGSRRKAVLVAGNFLPATINNRGVCQDLAEKLENVGWTVLTTSHHANRALRLLDMTSAVLRNRRDYDVAQVDVFSGRAFMLAEAACLALHSIEKPYVLTLHGGNLPSFACRWPKRVARLLQSADAVTTPSRYLLETMMPYRAGLRLHPNPLELSRYQFSLRRKVRPRLIWLRAFHQTYNPLMALHVVAMLEREFAGIHLTMIGPDKDDGSLQALRNAAKALGIADQIALPGNVPKSEVPNRLNDADIFLNTTNADNTPVSVLEAMACGLCVVSTNVGGIPYLLNDEHDALLVPPREPAMMARAVHRLLREPQLAENLSRNGRHHVEQFDWLRVLPKWDELLMSIVPGKK